MELEEFKRQFQARRREAQQERDELSKKAEDILKEHERLVELLKLFVAGEARLKDQGLDNLDMLEERLDKLADETEDISVEHEKLEDELSRQTVICPQCNGLGYIKGKPEWIEGDTGRIQIPKIVRCPLCEGKRIFAVDELLHC